MTGPRRDPVHELGDQELDDMAATAAAELARARALYPAVPYGVRWYACPECGRITVVLSIADLLADRAPCPICDAWAVAITNVLGDAQPPAPAAGLPPHRGARHRVRHRRR